jgi:formylglycine-generating enzyme required for sulfatase activity
VPPSDPAQPGVLDAPTAGVEVTHGEPDASVNPIGTWLEAQETPCPGTRRLESGVNDEEVCIPHGPFFLGDDRLDLFACEDYCFSGPERLVHVSSFYMDRYEVTVARWRAALAAGFHPPDGSWFKRPAISYCTYSDTDRAHETVPMNCVSWTAAAAFCDFDGHRSLPSEAQWEFVASGRGAEFMWPWGDDEPTCANASFARALIPGAPATPGSQNECYVPMTSSGIAPVGSFPIDMSRPTHDVPFGVMDLAGNAGEWVRDLVGGLCNPYWSQSALPIDPVQPIPEALDTSSGVFAHVTKGGTWASGAIGLKVAGRSHGFESMVTDPNYELGAFTGFRCVRAAVP